MVGWAKSLPDAARQLRLAALSFVVPGSGGHGHLCGVTVTAPVAHCTGLTLCHEPSAFRGGKWGSCLTTPYRDTYGSGTDGSLERWRLQEWLCETACACPERGGKGWGEIGFIQQLPFGCIHP